MSLPFAFRTLGPPVLLAPDGTPVRIRTRKHLALLAYLAIEPRHPVRRDFLAELLWPRAPMEEGRHSLATALSVLRGVLGEGAFESGRDMIRLTTARLAVDLERLESGDVLGDEFTPPLELGDLLQDFEIPDAPGFMHWLDRQRARWRPSLQAALLLLVDRARRSGDLRGLDRLADRLFALEDLSEQGMRAKMEAAALSGDRVGALKRYDRWVDRLHRELNAVPSPFMQRFAELLRRGGFERGPAAPMLGGSAAAAAEPFLGRGREYRALYEAWERTLERTPRHVVVFGESGVGKTTLVARFLAAAALEGAVTARVRCYEVERDIPYAAVGTLLRHLADQPGAAGTRPEALADLAVAVPMLRERFPGLPAPAEIQGEAARIRFTEAALELVVAVAEEAPVVLTVDDLHVADDASVAVLHLLLRRLSDERVSLVVTTGQGALARNAASRLLEAGESLGLARLPVEPLGEPVAHALLDALLGSVAEGVPRPGPAIRRALVRAARGFPLALVLLVRDWEAHAEEAVVLSLDAMTEAPRGEGEPANAYGLLLDRVVARLEQPTRAVLEYAAVLGSRMNELDWYADLGLEPGRVMMALSALTHQRVLRDGGSGLEFTNELMRAHLYVQIPAVIRRQLHLLATEQLLVRDVAPGAVSGLELAWHLMRSGRVAEATGYLLRGAREAIGRGAPFEAERALVTGAPVLQGASAKLGRVILAEALQEQGQHDEARQVLATTDFSDAPDLALYSEVLAVTALHGRDDLLPEERREAHSRLVQLSRSAGDDRAKAAAVMGAADFLERLQSPDVTSEMARLFESLSPPEDPELHSRYSLAKAKTLYACRRFEECSAVLASIIAQLERISIANTVLAEAYAGQGVLGCARGDYAAASGHFERALTLSLRIGNPIKARAYSTNRALCAFRLGASDDFIAFAESGLRVAQETHFAEMQELLLRGLLAIGYAIRAEPQRTYDEIARADSLQANVQLDWMAQAWQLTKADALQLLGREGEALRAARKAFNTDNGLLAQSRAGLYARWRARIALKDGKVTDAARELTEIWKVAENLDAMDKAEVLAALQLLDVDSIDRQSNSGLELSEALEALPDATRVYLRRVGTLAAS